MRLVDAVAEVRPERVLEVGCGWGELAEWIARETGATVVAVDLSPRMVELARERGVDARVADVQQLPFADGEFDCVVAAWMLYHVPDLDRAFAELARVLRPGGRLVAATNSRFHLLELRELVGSGPSNLSFSRESGDAAARAALRRRAAAATSTGSSSSPERAEVEDVRARVDLDVALRRQPAGRDRASRSSRGARTRSSWPTR